jgi:signal transduction histidine kinase
MRGGRLVAVVVHAPRAGRELEREIGSAARMAVENEALRAQVLAQLGELRASRGRIIEAGDAARRQLERNLHDGAQQRLLAVGFQLRLAGSRADPANAPTLEHADAEVSAAFDELRELAHGIFPAVLTEAGLEAALTQLAIAAPVAVEVDEAPVERLPAPVETSAYIAAAEAVRDAAERGAARVVLSARRTSDALVVVVEDDGMRRNGGLVHVADRVGALGGRLALAPTRVEAEIPCAS